MANNHVIFTYINQWENHSIAKIQLNAQQIRDEIRQTFIKRHEDFEHLLSEINTKLDVDLYFTNDDLEKWTKQVEIFRRDLLKFPSEIHLEHEKNQYPIYFIKLSGENKGELKAIDQSQNEDSIDIPGTRSLTRSMLNNASPNERKQMLGERLFVLVQQIEPNLAAKITGMFLEFDSKYIFILITSHTILKEKIKEAKNVLQAHARKQRNVTQ